ncbi:hypothetical protein J2786_003622 [Chryseobacterium vietnamense]|uniref:Uncharacterized protein n=1 Tax=Chryseobacterium vietnamense TaxID=866785 RepID=A0ACC6JC33_9FLAO|nr:hypothetical protein [Chryseobacterium vietnamense]MDR6460488.1 hypothetical protein [Chryseobacterium vietnamense]
MKKLTIRIDQWVKSTEAQWKTFPIKKQRFLTALFFTGYSLMTLLMIIIQIASKKGSDSKDMPPIRHIITKPADITIKSKEGYHSVYNSSQNNQDERPK